MPKLTREKWLERFCSIKPFVLGRKNWLFAGSEDGARSSCLLFSLIECAKIHNINPEDYLRCIFEQASNTDGWAEDDWKKLLPWNIKSHRSFHKAPGFRPKGSKIDGHQFGQKYTTSYNISSVYLNIIFLIW